MPLGFCRLHTLLYAAIHVGQIEIENSIKHVPMEVKSVTRPDARRLGGGHFHFDWRASSDLRQAIPRVSPGQQPAMKMASKPADQYQPHLGAQIRILTISSAASLASTLSYPMKRDRIARARFVHRVRLQIGSQASAGGGKSAEQADQSSHRCSGAGLPRRWSPCSPLHFIALLEQERNRHGLLTFSKKHPLQRLREGNRDRKTVVLTQLRISGGQHKGGA